MVNQSLYSSKFECVSNKWTSVVYVPSSYFFTYLSIFLIIFLNKGCLGLISSDLRFACFYSFMGFGFWKIISSELSLTASFLFKLSRAFSIRYLVKMAIMIFSGRDINSKRSQSISGMFFEVSLTYSSGLSKLWFEMKRLDGLSNNTDSANPCIFMRLSMFRMSKFL